MSTRPVLALHPPEDLLDRHPELGQKANELALAFRFHKPLDREILQAMGSALWQAVAPAAVIPPVSPRRPLSVQVRSDHPAVLRLPWETLYHPEHGFLARDPAFALARLPAESATPRGPLEQGPLRVLLFTSMPDGLPKDEGRLDVETEQIHVLEALHPFIRAGRVVLDAPDDGSFAMLEEALTRGYHLVFLSGHGRFQDAEFGNPADAFFLFEDAHGAPDPVSGTRIRDAFRNRGVSCVVLSACQTGQHASDALHSGLAGGLFAHAGIPNVVGMRESVGDVAARVFTTAFCKAVAEGVTLDLAVQAGRNAMWHDPDDGGPARKDGTPLPGDTHFCLPALYSRDPDWPLIDWDFTPEKPATGFRIYDPFRDLALPQVFVGRRREQRLLRRYLAQGERRILLTGMGGRGKTALAGKLARDLERAGWLVRVFQAGPDTNWAQFESLLKQALPPEMARQVDAAWLDLDAAARATLILQALQHAHGDQVLLLLDNLEELQDPAHGGFTHPGLAALAAPAATGPAVLLTSRRRPPDFQDVCHPLAPPSYGDFLRFAQGLKGSTTGDDLRRRYDLLGGNFKALQVVAALCAEGDADDLEQQLARADADLRRDLALDKAFERLAPDARILLRRWTLFPVPVIEDAAHILGDDLKAPRKHLHALVAVSLVDVTRDRHGLQKYGLSPLVTRWLADRGEHPDPARAAPAARFLLHCFEHLDRTVDAAVAAHDALRAAGLTELADSLVLDTLVGYYTRRGMYAELKARWLSPILASPVPKTRAEALGQMGKLCLHTSDYGTALPYLEQSLAIRREIGDKAGEGTTLSNISTIHYARGAYDQALAYLEQARVIQREIGDKYGEGTTLNNISTIHYARGAYDQALPYLEQSLVIQREIGDKYGEGATLNNIGGIHRARGAYDQALAYLEQALVIRREIGDKSGEGTTLNNISQIYDARGAYDQALAYLEQALVIRREIGDKSGEGVTLNNISGILHARGAYDQALAYMEQALVVQREIGDKSGEGTTLNNISQIYHAQGAYDQALAYLEQALVISREIGDKSGEGTTLNNISQIYNARGAYDQALAYLEQARVIQREIGDKSGEATALNNISTIHLARGAFDQALAYLEQALIIYREIGDRSGMCATLYNMGHLSLQKENLPQAMDFWLACFGLARSIGEAQALKALDGLARQLGGEGLADWEALDREAQNAGAPPSDDASDDGAG